MNESDNFMSFADALSNNMYIKDYIDGRTETKVYKTSTCCIVQWGPLLWCQFGNFEGNSLPVTLTHYPTLVAGCYGVGGIWDLYTNKWCKVNVRANGTFLDVSLENDSSKLNSYRLWGQFILCGYIDDSKIPSS